MKGDSPFTGNRLCGKVLRDSDLMVEAIFFKNPYNPFNFDYLCMQTRYGMKFWLVV